MADTKLTEFLKTSRQNAGLSQAAVAEILGYTTAQFISNWERGESQPPVSTLKTIAKIYEVSEKQLFDIFETVTIEQVRLDIRTKFLNSGKRKKA